MDNIPLIIITGPTATGKTAVAVEVAKILDGEVVSADSMQIYRQMDIGTAKPTLDEMGGIPHHLIDIVEPDANFTVAIYQQLARDKIAEINQRNKIPILAGGTGFYIDSVIYDYDFGSTGIDRSLRHRLSQEAREKGSAILHQRLATLDLPAAKQIHPNDLKRIIRALEVYYLTNGRSSLSHRDHKVEFPGYKKLMIGLHYPRQVLYQRIEDRVDQMIDQGLVDEVSKLLSAGYDPGLTSMQSLGYKEIAHYLLKGCPLEETVRLIKRNTRRFAKRQLTWFKRYSSIKWVDMEQEKTIKAVAGKISAQYKYENPGV